MSKFAAAVLAFACAAAANACTLSLRYEGGEIRWNPVPGADRYEVQESFNELATSRNFFTLRQSIAVAHRVTAPTTVFYRVYADISPQVQSTAGEGVPGCTATISIQLQPDPELRRITRRVVFPLVGSTPGAFGGRFKTSLTLTATSTRQKGRLVFHPASKAASDSDPSIAYSLEVPGDTRSFDDVVAEMGQSGIGSLDVVPDEAGEPIVPLAEARLFNDTAGGTFGTQAFAVFPSDYLHPAGVRLTPPDPRFRMNVGFRALGAASVTVLIHDSDGRLRDFHQLDFPAGWMQMTGLNEVAGSELKAGETMTLGFSGAIVPFYTLTENRTNDPALVVPDAKARSFNVGAVID
jgi:hypothetical protein